MSTTKKNYNSPNNYFLSDEAKAKAKYKLFIVIHPNYRAKWGGREKYVFWSINKRRNNGLDWLLYKAMSLRNEIIEGRIYELSTDKILYKIPGSDAEALNNLQTKINQNY